MARRRHALACAHVIKETNYRLLLYHTHKSGKHYNDNTLILYWYTIYHVGFLKKFKAPPPVGVAKNGEPTTYTYISPRQYLLKLKLATRFRLDGYRLVTPDFSANPLLYIYILL